MREKVAFVVAVALALVLTACGDSSPSAAQIYADAGKKMAELTSYHVSEEVRVEGELQPYRLEVDLVTPDRFRASTTLEEEGETLEVKWIAIADEWYVSLPPSEDYFILPEEEVGAYPQYLTFMEALSTQLSGLTYLGEEAVDEESAHHLQGSLPPEAMELVEPGERHTESVTVDLWVGVEDSLVRRYRLLEEDATTTLTLSSFDETMSIEAPADPRPFDELLQGPGSYVLGLRCAYASKYLREKYGLPDMQGCVILRVTSGGSAEAAGLAEGQMIIALEDVPITSGPQFTRFFGSLPEREQSYTVMRPGEDVPFTTTVTLGPRGEPPEFDSGDPYFFYLRARGAEDNGQAILDFTEAIKLAPDFDLAYVYRGSLYLEAMVLDEAMADLNHALELDGGNAEAYRWRADTYRIQGDYEAALADADMAIQLDRCAEAFRTYNYDCFVNHMIRGNSFGARELPGDSELAVAEAEAAIGFYPELPDPYYLAAYHLSLGGRDERARSYAIGFLERSGDNVAWLDERDWAERFVGASDEEQVVRPPETESPRLFVEASQDRDLVPDGAPVVTEPHFALERTHFGKTPVFVRSIGNDQPQIWAYFQFDNAAAVKTVRWEWFQSLAITDFGEEPWPGTNKGGAWLLLNNATPGINSRGALTILFDGETVASGDVTLLSDSFVSPATFYEDAAGTQPVLFYTGEPSTVYAELEYTDVLPGDTLVWTAEADGAQLGLGQVDLGEEGRAVVPIELPVDAEPGLIQIHFYVHDEHSRTAWLVRVPPEIAESPPFDRFDIGIEPDLNGRLGLITKVFPEGIRQIDYVLDGLTFGPDSVLTIQWFKKGRPVWPWPETWSGPDEGFPRANLSFGEFPEAGEYELMVTWDGVPVYADVVVVD